MSTYAVIVARGGEGAKTRWGAALGAAQRGELIAAMLADMIEALKACPAVDEIWLVTPTAALAEAARAAGARVLLEAEARGINRAFEAGREAIAAVEPEAVILALPGDLPLIERTEIETALDARPEGGVALVPASADGGTGAVVLRASDPFVFRFGADSFAKHLAAAHAAGLSTHIERASGLGLDIDRPEDLEEVLRRAPAGRTARLLVQLQRLTEAP